MRPDCRHGVTSKEETLFPKSWSMLASRLCLEFFLLMVIVTGGRGVMG